MYPSTFCACALFCMPPIINFFGHLQHAEVFGSCKYGFALFKRTWLCKFVVVYTIWCSTGWDTRLTLLPIQRMLLLHSEKNQTAFFMFIKVPFWSESVGFGVPRFGAIVVWLFSSLNSGPITAGLLMVNHLKRKDRNEHFHTTY